MGRRRRLAMGVLVGGAVLGAAGGAEAAAGPEPVSASALVFSAPDPAVVEQARTGSEGGDPAARAGAYLDTELAYLRGADLPARVARSLTDTPAPVLEAIRVGRSNVLDITVTATDPVTAERQAQAAMDIYVRERRQRLIDRIDIQIAAIDRRVQATEAALAALGRPPRGETDPRGRQRAALTQQYVGQLVERDALQRAAAEVSQVARPVQRATVLATGSVPAEGISALGAAATGALLGALVVALTDVLARRVRDERDLEGLDVPVLAPPLPRRRPATHSWGALERAVHLQALLMPGASAPGGSLAVLGAGDGVGATFTAVQHARLAARRRPTLLVYAGGRSTALEALVAGPVSDLRPRPVHRPLTAHALLAAARSTSVPDLSVLTLDVDPAVFDDWLSELLPTATRGGCNLVVASPPLGRSGIGVTVARRCREAVVVAALGRSRVTEVHRTVRILRSAGASVGGIVLTHRPWLRPPGAVRRAISGEDRPGACDGAPTGLASPWSEAGVAGEPAGVGSTAAGRLDGRATRSSPLPRSTSTPVPHGRPANRAPSISTTARVEPSAQPDRPTSVHPS